MRRLLFNLLATASLLVWLYSVVAAAFEARGYNHGYAFARMLDAARRPSLSPIGSQPIVTFELAGFKRMENVDVYGRPFRVVFVPHWVGVIIFAILPMLWLRENVARRRLRKCAALNRCPVCGYDLRATPEQCPECGAIPSDAKGAMA